VPASLPALCPLSFRPRVVETAAVATSPALASGTLLTEKYRILDLLGQGGMGAVYLAENVDIGRQVAIKVLKPELASEPEAMARFRQEARASASIGHPGIVEILDMGMLPDGGAFIVMERLEGETLRERLARLGSMGPHDAVALMASVLETLAAAHDKGVIHRDLKPDNIFLAARPVPATKILDFGISKFRGQGDVALTRTGVVMGTPLYMSPEQARGARDVGVTADIYSMGAILYEALSGQPPFPGESYNEVLAKVLMDTAKPLGQLRGDVPPALADVVQRMLGKDPASRPATARDAAAQLRESIGGVPMPRGTSGTHLRSAVSLTPAPAHRTGPQAPAALEATFTPPARASSGTPPARASWGTSPAHVSGSSPAAAPAPETFLRPSPAPSLPVAAPPPGKHRLVIGLSVAVAVLALLGVGIWLGQRSTAAVHHTPAHIDFTAQSAGGGTLHAHAESGPAAPQEPAAPIAAEKRAGPEEPVPPNKPTVDEKSAPVSADRGAAPEPAKTTVDPVQQKSIAARPSPAPHKVRRPRPTKPSAKPAPHEAIEPFGGFHKVDSIPNVDRAH